MKKSFTLTTLALFISLASFALGPITGSLGICIGGTSTLHCDSTVTGTWSSSTPAVATVGASTGVVTGISAGTATISFSTSIATSTAVVTVSPAPAAIGGGSVAICAGTSITLTDATSGGTWSCTPTWAATIGASTGVLTGVSAAVVTVHYTVGSCSVSTNVTVNATVVTDSIYGAYSVCVGSSTTYTIATTGGTWSSSNTAVATVSSTGVVTGVSAGVANISYTITGPCGPGSASQPITVTSTTSTGTIYGTATVTAGATTTLHETVAGGTWSSGTPAVATIGASTGVVTGVTAGTAVVTYTVSGCGGTAYTTTIVTVNALNGISGNVLFGGTSAYYGSVKVWLIKYNPSTSWLSAIDSQTVYCSSGTSVYYQFLGMATDSYRVKAAVVDTLTFSSTGYIPTYHTAQYFWHDATVIYHTSGTSDINKNINMAYGTTTSGPGFIAGNVTTGANKGTSGAPAVGLLMFVINESTSAVMARTLTDASGNYSFSNLPVGQTYRIYPELINYATTPFTSINLTASAPSMSAGNFVQHTISHTITPVLAAVSSVNSVAYVFMYPNPAGSKLTVEWNMAHTEKGTVTITDIAGREMFSSEVSMNNGAGSMAVDVSSYADGLYLVSVKSESVSYTNKVQVQH